MLQAQSNHDPRAGVWSLQAGSQELLRYLYKNEQDPGPAFSVVRTLEGIPLALYRPWDHVWHTGLYFSWKKINGFNVWESAYSDEPNTCRSISFEELTGGRIGFKQTAEHVTSGGTTLLLDERELEVVKAPHGYIIQARFTFWTPGEQEAVLDRTPITEKSPWGGYAGLSMRLERTFMQPVITTDNGVIGADEMYGKTAKWCDYSGRVDGFADEWAGVCMMDAASNERHPSPFLTYDLKKLQFLNAAFVAHEPYMIHAGEKLTLRYAVYIHDGKADPAFIDAYYGEHMQKAVQR